MTCIYSTNILVGYGVIMVHHMAYEVLEQTWLSPVIHNRLVTKLAVLSSFICHHIRHHIHQYHIRSIILVLTVIFLLTFLCVSLTILKLSYNISFFSYYIWNQKKLCIATFELLVLRGATKLFLHFFL